MIPRTLWYPDIMEQFWPHHHFSREKYMHFDYSLIPQRYILGVQWADFHEVKNWTIKALLNPHWLKIKLNKLCSFLRPMRNLKLSSGTWLAVKIKTIIFTQQIRRLNEIVYCYLSILIFKIQSLNICLIGLILSLVSLITS